MSGVLQKKLDDARYRNRMLQFELIEERYKIGAYLDLIGEVVFCVKRGKLPSDEVLRQVVDGYDELRGLKDLPL